MRPLFLKRKNLKKNTVWNKPWRLEKVYTVLRRFMKTEPFVL